MAKYNWDRKRKKKSCYVHPLQKVRHFEYDSIESRRLGNRRSLEAIGDGIRRSLEETAIRYNFNPSLGISRLGLMNHLDGLSYQGLIERGYEIIEVERQDSNPGLSLEVRFKVPMSFELFNMRIEING